MVGDLSKPLDLGGQGGPFDLVVAAWLLNYAETAEDMTAMWRNIAQNLRPGGHFIGLTTPDPGGVEKIKQSLEKVWPKYGVSGTVNRKVKDGFGIHNILGFPESGQIEIDNFYLQDGVREKTAKQGGMLGHFDWLPVYLSQELTDEHEPGFWDQVHADPQFQICVVARDA